VGPRAPNFFIAENIPQLEADISEVYRFSRAAHELPIAVKQAFAGQGGAARFGATYSGMDAGQAEPSYDPKTVASARSWDYARLSYRHSTRPPSAASAPEMDGFDFVAVCDDLYERQNVIGEAFLEGLAEALGEPRDCFSRHFAAGDLGTIRLLSYPGSEDPHAAAADVGIAPHTDFEAFTLMQQTAPGLQFLVRGAEGRGAKDGGDAWLDAPAGPFAIIVGDVLERFTNGVLRATPHRVVRTEAPRMSIIRFNAVAPETLIAPLPAFVSAERPCTYTAVTMARHMEVTLANLEAGMGSWDAERQVSTSATRVYA